MSVSKYTKSSGGIWARMDNYSFNYSDGDEIENRLLNQVRQAKDVSLASDELQRLMVDWPSEYHFSPLRANLLSSFYLHKFKNILEIGSGCGAMTRVLGEQCPESAIIALEGSMRRAEITRARCRDLPNVEVYQESFIDFAPDYAFDLITMIGVLEYSPSYFTGDDPVVDALQHARTLLSNDGVLVVAIENQLGLKYFNGCAEDHNGEPFFGINDQYQPGTFRTFGREKLQQQFARAGFDRLEFMYPFPDYKLPRLLLREESFQSNSLDLSYLIGQHPSRDYGRDADKVFQEARAWHLLTENGLAQDLTNSFLVFAFTGNKSLQDITDSWLVKSFSGRRKKQYIIETVFQKEYDKIVVEKNLSYPSIAEHSRDDQRAAVVKHHIGKAKYIKGRPYDYTLPDHVSSGDPVAGFIRYVTPWVNWLQEQAVQGRSTPHDEEELMLPGTLYECMPSNVLIDRQGEFHLIDQEWEYNEPLELGFVLFRGLYQEFSVNMDFFQQVDLFRNTSVQSVQGVYEEIFKVFDINFNQEIVNRYIDLEVAVQLELVPYSIDRIALTEFLRKFFQEPRMKKISFSELLKSGGTDRFGLLVRQKEILDQRVAERDESIQILNQVLADRDETIGLLNRTVWDRDATIESLNQRVTELDNDLKYLKGLSAEYHMNYLTVTGSSSWRWTAPLRLAGYLARGDFDRAALAGRKIRQKIRMGPGRLADRLLEKLRLPVPPDAESDINNVALNAIIRERCRSTAESLVADPLSASLSEEFPFVDISAVTFNSEKWIPDFIESLLALDYPKSSLKICFVDNGSSDATVDCLRQGVAQLTADGYAAADIIQQKNLGYGAGHNRAIQSGTAPFCLITNVDLTFEPEALKRVVGTARADTATAAAWELRQIPYEHPKFYDPVTGMTNWNAHACILLRRSTLEKVGLYDETLFMYGEDVELSYRFRRSGAILRYCPHAAVRHYSYSCAEEIKPLQYTGSTFANLYLRLKYGRLKDIQSIPMLARHLLSVPEPYAGARRAVVRNLLRLLLITPKALASRRKAVGQTFFPFYRWDYELVRDGAFVAHPTLPEEPEKIPLITIITRTYQGRSLYLRQALLSVAHQTYPNIEHIVVEDGGNSLQTTVEEIGCLTGRPALYVSNEKLGRSSAGNVGLAQAKGRWCLFLDDDDLLFADHLELLAGTLLEDSDAVAAYSLAWEVQTDSSGIADGKYSEEEYKVPQVLKEEYNYTVLEHHNLMAIQSVLFERRLFEERGGFDADLDALEDWVLWLCYGYGNRFVYVPKVTSMYRTPSGQTVRKERQEVLDVAYTTAKERVHSRMKSLGLLLEE